jgi:nitrous oxidase accessory protein NosD
LPDVGGKIYIRNGNYNINTTLVINRYGITLEGEGKGTILWATVNPIRIEAGVLKFTIRNMWIRDTNETKSFNGITAIGTSTNKISWIKIEDVEFRGFRDAVHLEYVDFSVIDRCVIFACYNGIYLKNCGNDKITRCHISSCDYAGVIADGDVPAMCGLVVSENAILATKYPVYLNPTDSAHVVDNELEAMDYGVVIKTYKAEKCYIANNWVATSDQATARADGINLEGSIESIVAGNTVANVKYGIIITKGLADRNPQYNRIIGNVLYNNSDCDVLITDALDNIVLGNICLSTGVASSIAETTDVCDRNIIAFNRIVGNVVRKGTSIVRNNPKWDTENFKSTGLSVSVGTGGNYGSATSITSPSGRITFPRVKITWGGTFGAGETVTVKVEAVYTDGSSVYIEKSATATGSLWLTDDDIIALISQGKDIVKLNIYAKTNLSSTSVTVTVNAYGKG